MITFETSGRPGQLRANRKLKQRKQLGKFGLNTAAVVVFVFAVFPVYWMVTTAFKSSEQIFTTDFIPFPTDPTLDHVKRVFTEGVAGHSIWRYLLNSSIVALGTVLIGAVFSLFAATAVARFRFRGRASFLVLLLIVQMVPGEALLIPLFIMVTGGPVRPALRSHRGEHRDDAAVRDLDAPHLRRGGAQGAGGGGLDRRREPVHHLLAGPVPAGGARARRRRASSRSSPPGTSSCSR